MTISIFPAIFLEFNFVRKRNILQIHILLIMDLQPTSPDLPKLPCICIKPTCLISTSSNMNMQMNKDLMCRNNKEA